jgi:hypothetical protein
MLPTLETTAPESIEVLIEGQTILLPRSIAGSDETLKRALAPFYPGISNAAIKRDEKTGKIEIFKKAGTKGSYDTCKVTITIPIWIARRLRTMIQEWIIHEKASQEFAKQENNPLLTKSYQETLQDYEDAEQNIRQATGDVAHA